MFRYFFLRFVFFFSLFSFFPFVTFAFEVSPSVVDVSFGGDISEVTQVFSVFNTFGDVRVYTAEVQEVIFAADGSIAGFSSISSEIDASVSPSFVSLNPATEQSFTVRFAHPEAVTADQVFALVVHERRTQDDELVSGFVALVFPQDISGTLQGSLRIDAFAVTPSFAEHTLEISAQFTNTSDVLVRPTSMIVISNRFGTELGRLAFSPFAGRLPVGTTRRVSDVFPLFDFGFWHVGGPVTFTLLTAPFAGGAVQRASVHVSTNLGSGIFLVSVCFLFFLVGLVVFWVKKRGILRS